MIEVENTDVNIVRNLIPMRNLMPASAYGLKAISDWFFLYKPFFIVIRSISFYGQTLTGNSFSARALVISGHILMLNGPVGFLHPLSIYQKKTTYRNVGFRLQEHCTCLYT